MTNLSPSLARARRVLKRRWRRALRRLMFPLLSLIASMVTIALAYFNRSGSFQFNKGAWLDWIVAGIILLLATACILQIRREMSASPDIIVNRDELTDLVTLARHDATHTVRNMAGDLTWLAEDRETLLAIRQNNPNVDFRIYYESGTVPRELRPVVDELSKNGIRFIPYPNGFKPGFQCMLVDGEHADEKRVCATPRVGGKLTGQERSNQLFRWIEYSSEDKLVPDAINGIVNLIDSWPRPPVLVGITGVNNVGKTLLASALRDSLSKECSPHLFIDPFREPTSGVTLQDNFRMMIFQLLASKTNSSADVCIFDTTIAETLCYLALRGAPTHDQSYQQLAHACADAMRSFDLIVEVQKDKDDIDSDTKYLTAADRCQIRENLSDFYNRYAVPKERVILKTDAFEDSLRVESETLSRRIVQVLNSRNRASA